MIMWRYVEIIILIIIKNSFYIEQQMYCEVHSCNRDAYIDLSIDFFAPMFLYVFIHAVAKLHRYSYLHVNFDKIWNKFIWRKAGKLGQRE